DGNPPALGGATPPGQPCDLPPRPDRIETEATRRRRATYGFRILGIRADGEKGVSQLVTCADSEKPHVARRHRDLPRPARIHVGRLSGRPRPADAAPRPSFRRAPPVHRAATAVPQRRPVPLLASSRPDAAASLPKDLRRGAGRSRLPRPIRPQP